MEAPWFQGAFVYSAFRLFAGSAIAAFMAWKHTVNKAIKMAIAPAVKNIHKLMLKR